MNVNDYFYELPEELIAQVPLKTRSDSKLLVLNKLNGEIKHKKFTDIIDYLHKGDVLVVNDTSVIPARLYGVKEETKALIEVLLLSQIEGDVWEALVKKAKKIKVGTIISFGEGVLKAKCTKVLNDGLRHFEMIYKGVFYEVLGSLGEMPLPPYIHEKLEDQNRYQTVYNRVKGSAAAPTAGLHFTKDLLKKIEDKGVILTSVTLHVGLGTFRPVQVEKIEDHEMHSEFYMMSKKTADILNDAKQENRRIIAVGTTSLRTLETIMTEQKTFKEISAFSQIFIYPGYEFKAIDALITNFHLPKSTLLMLVSALSSKEIIFNAYKEAIKNNYRFFSFGDSMFISNE
ncbi:tRNA preQ1(34) S-adenosylmethionine ribosyltransferase-isomerase QueA [Candidatus Izimaplasma bacterium ZiA1]|uniref:tRNA preQ1(34) S-adenosylmethionine ribosyltransferase-isomerase QueA n=1 Tax=Candidatus Izimoplasma sp. ZiA1 TaxID=2024899 RepID=UPI000BAA5E9E|nr:tRNA preQ1(34) S-adenosylmethionine ribosyltransferase-isomerase QueA [Candidatus Izimaplasma bacterium ZiA1]